MYMQTRHHEAGGSFALLQWTRRLKSTFFSWAQKILVNY